MTYSHYIGPGLHVVQLTGLAQEELMGSGPSACLGPVWTFLQNILEPIVPDHGPV